MTGTMHIADHQGDTTHTWDTADPRTIREIEEMFREAQATGRLVYRQTSDGRGEQVRLASWNPQEHTELFVAPGWPAASAFGHDRSDLVGGRADRSRRPRALPGDPAPPRLGCGGASAPGQAASRGAVVGLAVTRPAPAVSGQALV
jgi:hypothetical protein